MLETDGLSEQLIDHLLDQKDVTWVEEFSFVTAGNYWEKEDLDSHHRVDPTFIHTSWFTHILLSFSLFNCLAMQPPWSRYHGFISSELLLPSVGAASFSSEVWGGDSASSYRR